MNPTSNTRTLFDRMPSARAKDPQSSFQAADKVNRSGERQRQCDKVLIAMEQTLAVGWSRRITALELAAATGLDRYMISRRLPDLVTTGKVKRGDDENGLNKICSVCGERCLAFWLP